MAQYWLINTVSIGDKHFPGELVDDAVDNVAVLRAAGAFLYPRGASSAVDSAAAVAQTARRFRGVDEAALESIMQSAVNSLDVAATATTAGLMPAAQFAARIQKFGPVTIGEAAFVSAVNGAAETVNVGAALPENACILTVFPFLATAFSGGGATSVSMDIGATIPGQSAALNRFVAAMDVFTGAQIGYRPLNMGAGIPGIADSAQITLTLTPDAGHTTGGLTAGSVLIFGFYFLVF